MVLLMPFLSMGISYLDFGNWLFRDVKFYEGRIVFKSFYWTSLPHFAFSSF